MQDRVARRPREDVTTLLVEWSKGNEQALEKLMPLVYEELRARARHYLRREHRGHTLQTTELVHEAYLRLVDQKNVRWQNRAHFYAIAAQLMRRILVDHARRRRAARRGGLGLRLSLDRAVALPERPEVDILAIDGALKSLAALDPQQSRIVELRFFGALTIEETAEALGVSPATVKRNWTMAKAWLHHKIMKG